MWTDLGFIKEGIFIGTNRSNLIKGMGIFAKITEECLESGNEIFLIKNNYLSSKPFIFGTKLKSNGELPNSVILNFNSLLGSDEIDVEFINSRHSYNKSRSTHDSDYMEMRYKSTAIATDFFDYSSDDFETLIKDFLFGSERLSYVYLHLYKDKAEFAFVTRNSDYDNLKKVTKKIRNQYSNFTEYFYQKNDCFMVDLLCSGLSGIKPNENDTHRVIFEK